MDGSLLSFSTNLTIQINLHLPTNCLSVSNGKSLFLGSENPSDNRNQFCLHNWAECVGVACITSALYLSVPNVLGQFSNHLSEQAIHDGVEMYKKSRTAITFCVNSLLASIIV